MTSRHRRPPVNSGFTLPAFSRRTLGDRFCAILMCDDGGNMINGARAPAQLSELSTTAPITVCTKDTPRFYLLRIKSLSLSLFFLRARIHVCRTVWITWRDVKSNRARARARGIALLVQDNIRWSSTCNRRGVGRWGTLTARDSTMD